MHGRARRRLGGWMLLLVAVLAVRAAAQQPAEAAALQQAQKLAWSRHFAEAERIYRHLLRQSPNSRDVRVGLARVLLWEGRYREARTMFLQLVARHPSDVDAAEGAATAAYWQGDFRTAAREFRALAAAHPERTSAVKSLHDILLATRGSERVLLDATNDNQPYRLWRSEAVASVFSDPLTRWDVTAGLWRADNPRLSVVRSGPYVVVSNEVGLPWQRLTITTSAGVLRWPDGTTRPIGGVAARLRTSATSSIEAAIDHRELLRTSTAIGGHPAVTRMLLSWSRYAEKEWLAGFESGRLQYFDRNRGWYVQGYGLWPVMGRGPLTVFAGASAALRDTRDSRFYIEAIASERSGSEFLYAYRGAYTPYWTPQHLQETRAIVTASEAVARNATIKIQAEAGVARDRAQSFGPSEGPSPLPSTIFVFDFQRTFHPTRFSVGASLALSPVYALELSAERNTTVFYRANEFRATVVRHR